MSRCDVDGKYTDMTIDVLKYHLRQAGESLKGNKDTLCERLRRYHASPGYRAEQARLQQEKEDNEYRREKLERQQELQERDRRWAQIPPFSNLHVQVHHHDGLKHNSPRLL